MGMKDWRNWSTNCNLIHSIQLTEPWTLYHSLPSSAQFLRIPSPSLRTPLRILPSPAWTPTMTAPSAAGAATLWFRRGEKCTTRGESSTSATGTCRRCRFGTRRRGSDKIFCGLQLAWRMARALTAPNLCSVLTPAVMSTRPVTFTTITMTPASTLTRST